MEKKSLPFCGQPQDGQPSETPPSAKNQRSAAGKPQLSKPTTKKTAPRQPTGRKRVERKMSESKHAFLLNRIAEVRVQQGLSLRTVSRRTGLPVRELRVQERPSANLSLKDLHIWKEALEVPLEHLLIDRDLSICQSIQSRASLVKIMKTVASVREIVVSQRLIRMLDMLKHQLVELMPELSTVRAWQTNANRRPQDELGRMAVDPILLGELSFQLD